MRDTLMPPYHNGCASALVEADKQRTSDRTQIRKSKIMMCVLVLLEQREHHNEKEGLSVRLRITW